MICIENCRVPYNAKRNNVRDWFGVRFATTTQRNIMTRKQLVIWLALTLTVGAPTAQAQEKCVWESGSCFGVNWVTVTAKDVAGIDIKARAKLKNTEVY